MIMRWISKQVEYQNNTLMRQYKGMKKNMCRYAKGFNHSITSLSKSLVGFFSSTTHIYRLV
ncbi:hypothetical protein HanIR_Chr13g0649831 [Helianthus annuus]|nr:hypothetical protein HanIR_Chr13g0649831 [Helianthus annuus]